MVYRIAPASVIAAILAGLWLSSDVSAYEGHWKRVISYQNKSDLFANYQVGPNPSGTAAEMYISPRPVPPHVGHTYTTYQPLMPHELMYKHCRSHYAYTPGAGWTRSKVRYCTYGLKLQDVIHNLRVKY